MENSIEVASLSVGGESTKQNIRDEVSLALRQARAKARSRRNSSVRVPVPLDDHAVGAAKPVNQFLNQSVLDEDSLSLLQAKTRARSGSFNQKHKVQPFSTNAMEHPTEVASSRGGEKLKQNVLGEVSLALKQERADNADRVVPPLPTDAMEPSIEVASIKVGGESLKQNIRDEVSLALRQAKARVRPRSHSQMVHMDEKKDEDFLTPVEHDLLETLETSIEVESKDFEDAAFGSGIHVGLHHSQMRSQLPVDRESPILKPSIETDNEDSTALSDEVNNSFRRNRSAVRSRSEREKPATSKENDHGSLHKVRNPFKIIKMRTRSGFGQVSAKAERRSVDEEGITPSEKSINEDQDSKNSDFSNGVLNPSVEVASKSSGGKSLHSSIGHTLSVELGRDDCVNGWTSEGSGDVVDEDKNEKNDKLFAERVLEPSVEVTSKSLGGSTLRKNIGHELAFEFRQNDGVRKWTSEGKGVTEHALIDEVITAETEEESLPEQGQEALWIAKKMSESSSPRDREEIEYQTGDVEKPGHIVLLPEDLFVTESNGKSVGMEKLRAAADKVSKAKSLLDEALGGPSPDENIGEEAFRAAVEARMMWEPRRRRTAELIALLTDASLKGRAEVKHLLELRENPGCVEKEVEEEHEGRAIHFMGLILPVIDESKLAVMEVPSALEEPNDFDVLSLTSLDEIMDDPAKSDQAKNANGGADDEEMEVVDLPCQPLSHNPSLERVDSKSSSRGRRFMGFKSMMGSSSGKRTKAAQSKPVSNVTPGRSRNFFKKQQQRVVSPDRALSQSTVKASSSARDSSPLRASSPFRAPSPFRASSPLRAPSPLRASSPQASHGESAANKRVSAKRQATKGAGRKHESDARSITTKKSVSTKKTNKKIDDANTDLVLSDTLEAIVPELAESIMPQSWATAIRGLGVEGMDDDSLSEAESRGEGRDPSGPMVHDTWDILRNLMAETDDEQKLDRKDLSFLGIGDPKKREGTVAGKMSEANMADLLMPDAWKLLRGLVEQGDENDAEQDEMTADDATEPSMEDEQIEKTIESTQKPNVSKPEAVKNNSKRSAIFGRMFRNRKSTGKNRKESEESGMPSKKGAMLTAIKMSDSRNKQKYERETMRIRSSVYVEDESDDEEEELSPEIARRLAKIKAMDDELNKKLNHAVENEDSESVTSLNNVKMFGMTDQVQDDRSKDGSRDGSRGRAVSNSEKKPVTHELSPERLVKHRRSVESTRSQPQFVAAPKGIPAILTAKSWESIMSDDLMSDDESVVRSSGPDPLVHRLGSNNVPRNVKANSSDKLSRKLAQISSRSSKLPNDTIQKPTSPGSMVNGKRDKYLISNENDRLAENDRYVAIGAATSFEASLESGDEREVAVLPQADTMSTLGVPSGIDSTPKHRPKEDAPAGDKYVSVTRRPTVSDKYEPEGIKGVHLAKFRGRGTNKKLLISDKYESGNTAVSFDDEREYHANSDSAPPPPDKYRMDDAPAVQARKEQSMVQTKVSNSALEQHNVSGTNHVNLDVTPVVSSQKIIIGRSVNNATQPVVSSQKIVIDDSSGNQESKPKPKPKLKRRSVAGMLGFGGKPGVQQKPKLRTKTEQEIARGQKTPRSTSRTKTKPAERSSLPISAATGNSIPFGNQHIQDPSAQQSTAPTPEARKHLAGQTSPAENLAPPELAMMNKSIGLSVTGTINDSKSVHDQSKDKGPVASMKDSPQPHLNSAQVPGQLGTQGTLEKTETSEANHLDVSKSSNMGKTTLSRFAPTRFNGKILPRRSMSNRQAKAQKLFKTAQQAGGTSNESNAIQQSRELPDSGKGGGPPAESDGDVPDDATTGSIEAVHVAAGTKIRKRSTKGPSSTEIVRKPAVEESYSSPVSVRVPSTSDIRKPVLRANGQAKARALLSSTGGSKVAGSLPVQQAGSRNAEGSKTVGQPRERPDKEKSGGVPSATETAPTPGVEEALPPHPATRVPSISDIIRKPKVHRADPRTSLSTVDDKIQPAVTVEGTGQGGQNDFKDYFPTSFPTSFPVDFDEATEGDVPDDATTDSIEAVHVSAGTKMPKPSVKGRPSATEFIRKPATEESLYSKPVASTARVPSITDIIRKPSADLYSSPVEEDPLVAHIRDQKSRPKRRGMDPSTRMDAIYSRGIDP